MKMRYELYSMPTVTLNNTGMCILEIFFLYLSTMGPRGELSYLAPLGSENISTPYFKQCSFWEGEGEGITPPDSQTPHPPVPRQK